MGINLRRDQEPKQKIDLKYKNICVTGTIPGYTRIEFEIYLNKTYYVKNNSTVRSYTDYLIVGNDPGMTKINVAKARDVKIISYKDLEL
ncbi:MAG: hypothetical protein M0R17_03240 [Candidatus Omnitrophica bacterium]|jgi:NAD-dependent DNA ligase|nr:hypothetical protein [Candidatus Omnitrophota bacterium]